MKQLIEELRHQLKRAAKFQDDDVVLDYPTAEQLLDRLEKLEAVAEAVEDLDIMKTLSTGRNAREQHVFDVLAALGEK